MNRDGHLICRTRIGRHFQIGLTRRLEIKRQARIHLVSPLLLFLAVIKTLLNQHECVPLVRLVYFLPSPVNYIFCIAFVENLKFAYKIGDGVR